MLSSSGPLTEMKLRPDSLATACWETTQQLIHIIQTSQRLVYYKYKKQNHTSGQALSTLLYFWNTDDITCYSGVQLMFTDMTELIVGCMVSLWWRTLASRVFPHPGGPASSTPEGADSPRALNCSGERTGACGSHTQTHTAVLCCDNVGPVRWSFRLERHYTIECGKAQDNRHIHTLPPGALITHKSNHDHREGRESTCFVVDN